MAKTLAEQIEDRKKEAEKRNIGSKAIFVAKYLGRDLSPTNESGTQDVFKYEGQDLSIDYEFHADTERGESVEASHEEIKSRGETVFLDQGGKLKSYIPGMWENTLNSLFIRAEEAAKGKKRADKQAHQQQQYLQEAEERRKWGL